MTSTYTTLLRRTAAAFAAISGVALSATAFAQSPGSVRLETTTGTTTATECSYGTMSVQPNGAIRVVCSGSISVTGGAPSTGPTTFSFSTSGSTVPANSMPSLSVVRGGTSDGQYTIGYWLTGAGCATPGTYYMTFASGSSGAKTVSEIGMGGSGACTITLGAAIMPDGSSGDPMIAPKSATFTVGTSGGGPTVPAGCPTVPTNVQHETFGVRSSKNVWKGDPTGSRMIIAKMPLWPDEGIPALVKLNSPFASTPPEGTVRFSVSKCPGEIKDDYRDACNQKVGLWSTTLYWVPRPTGYLNNKEIADRDGYCWAPEAEGPWYINIRYEFNGVCGAGDTTCGVVWQYY